MVHFKPVKPGDAFNPGYDEWNAMLDAAKANKRAPRPVSMLRYASNGMQQIDVENDTSIDRAQGEILALNEPLILPTINLSEFQKVMFKGIEPFTDGAICILQGPLAAGQIGKAWTTSPILPALINVMDEDSATCGVEEGEYKLRTGLPGFDIIWKTATGTGDKWAYISPAMCLAYLAKTNGSVAEDDIDVPLSVWDESVPGDTTVDLTANYNWAENGDISSGKEVLVLRVGGINRIVGKECE